MNNGVVACVICALFYQFIILLQPQQSKQNRANIVHSGMTKKISILYNNELSIRAR
jgi:hypothetical protein